MNESVFMIIVTLFGSMQLFACFTRVFSRTRQPFDLHFLSLFLLGMYSFFDFMSPLSLMQGLAKCVADLSIKPFSH